MNRIKRLFPIMLIVMLITAVACALAACGDLYNYNHTYDNESLYTVASSGRAGISEIRDIDVDWYNGTITVICGEAGSLVTFSEFAEGEEPSRDTTMHYLVDGTTLRIKYAKSGTLSVGKLVKHLTVTVPSDMYLGEIDIDGTSADISVMGISAREIEVDNVSGLVNLKCSANDVNVDTVSGNLYLECNADRVEADSVSGNVTVTCKSSPSRMFIDSTSGDVLLRLPGDLGFSLEYSTTSGLFKNAFSADTVQRGEDSFVYLNGVCDYKIDTTSGDLIIEKLLA